MGELIAKAGRGVSEGLQAQSRLYCLSSHKAKIFSAYFVALDKSTDINNDAQLAIFVRGVNECFKVTEKLLCLSPIHAHTTTNDIFQKLCDATEHGFHGIDW